jgi:hypothetical protein
MCYLPNSSYSVTLVILKSRSNECHSLVSTIGAYIAAGDWLYLRGNGLKPKAAAVEEVGMESISSRGRLYSEDNYRRGGH